MSKDSYEILENIGTGSFGTVSKIRRRDTQQIMVWKEINFGKMSEREKSQLVAEVNILRELRNPFVVKYHDRIIEKSASRLYIVMEYCGGGDLSRVIKNCKTKRCNLEESLIWKVFAQCLLALRECHRHVENGDLKPIIHRDLKPANILLDTSNNIKIGDFGLAKELSSQSKMAQTNVGTPYYMAPEIINEKAYDERSDIWSLGCLLYELAALRPPFEATNTVALGMKINQGKFARIPNKYSDNLFDAISNMLRVDTKRRPRVEELETLPALQSALTAARAVAAEYLAKEQRERDRQRTAAAGGNGTSEKDLKERESALKQREAACDARDATFLARESAVQAREGAVRAEEQRLHQWASQLRSLERSESIKAQASNQQISSQLQALPQKRVTMCATIAGDDMVVDNEPSAAPEPSPATGFTIHCDAPQAQPYQQPATRDNISSGVRRAKELLAGRSLTAGVAPALRAAPTIPLAPSGGALLRHGAVRTGAEDAKENVFAFALNQRQHSEQDLKSRLTSAAAAGSPFKKQRLQAGTSANTTNVSNPTSFSYRIGNAAGPVQHGAVHHVDLQALLHNR